jgi:hypothetical protein
MSRLVGTASEQGQTFASMSMTRHQPNFFARAQIDAALNSQVYKLTLSLKHSRQSESQAVHRAWHVAIAFYLLKQSYSR